MRIRPLSDEYPEYYGRYIHLVPDGEIEETLRTQQTEMMHLVRQVAEETAEHSYAAGKWTLKEVIGHLADTERVMSYRMLAIGRGERAPLPVFDQDAYVAAATFNAFPLARLLDDFEAVRVATISLATTLDEAAWIRRGTVGENVVSARALAYIIAGHERHHFTVLRDKYL